MNPQYLQQQSPYYGAQSPNSPYGEPNANLPPKGSQDNFPPQKPINAPPTSNAPPNQNNIVDQMSNVSLTGPQKPPSSVNGVHNQNHYPTQGTEIIL